MVRLAGHETPLDAIKAALGGSLSEYYQRNRHSLHTRATQNVVRVILLVGQRLDANGTLLDPGAPAVLPCLTKDLWLVVLGFLRGADHGVRPPNEGEAARLLDEHIHSAQALGAKKHNFASCAPLLTRTTGGFLHLATWAQENNLMTQCLDDRLDDRDLDELVEDVHDFMGESHAGSLAAYLSLRPGAATTHVAYTGIVTASLNCVLSGGTEAPFLFDTMPAAWGDATTDNDMNILTSAAFTPAAAHAMSGAFVDRQLADPNLAVLVVQGAINRELLMSMVTTMNMLTDDELLDFRRQDFSFSSGAASNGFGIYTATHDDAASGTNHFLVMFVPSLGTGLSRYVGTGTCQRNVYCLVQMGKWMDELLGRTSVSDTKNPLYLVSCLSKDPKANMEFAQAVVGYNGPEWTSQSQRGGKASVATHGDKMRNGGKKGGKKGGKASVATHGDKMRNGGKKKGKKINCKVPGCTAAPGTCPGRHNQKNCPSKFAPGAKPITKYFSPA